MASRNRTKTKQKNVRQRTLSASSLDAKPSSIVIFHFMLWSCFGCAASRSCVHFEMIKCCAIQIHFKNITSIAAEDCFAQHEEPEVYYILWWLLLLPLHLPQCMWLAIICKIIIIIMNIRSTFLSIYIYIFEFDCF